MLIQVANLKENLFVWFVLQLLLDCSFIHGIFFRENDFTKISRKTAAIFLLWWCEYCLFFWSLNFFTLFDTIYNSIRSNYNDYICSLEKKVFFEKSSIFYIELQHVYTKCPIKFLYYFNIMFFTVLPVLLPVYSFL